MIMKQITLILLLFLTISSIGQNLEKGIYRGQKLPFSICYLTYNDLKQNTGFDEIQFWDKLHSYELETYLTLDNVDFNKKLYLIKVDIKKTWR